MSRASVVIPRTIVILFISQLFHCAQTNNSQQLGSTTSQERVPAHLIHVARALRGPTTGSSPADLLQRAQQQLISHQFYQHQQSNARPSQATNQRQQQQQQPQLVADNLEPLNMATPATSDEELVKSAAARKQGLDETSGAAGSATGLVADPEAAAPDSGAYLGEPAPEVAPEEQNQQPPTPKPVERCQELINLALLSFRELAPLSESALDEIDCASLRAQLAAALAGRSLRPPLEQVTQQQRQTQLQPALPSSGAQPAGKAAKARGQPSAPANSGKENARQRAPEPAGAQATSTRSRQAQTGSQPLLELGNSEGWTPRANAHLSQQLQQLKMQQQHRLQQEQFERALQRSAAGSAQPASSAVADSESAPETTTQQAQEQTSTPPSSSSRPAPRKARIRAGGPRRRPGGPQRARGGSSTSTTTTTSTTTARPSTAADYADGSELSTDYYDEYEDLSATTTTSTTTARPRGRKPKRFRTSSTSTSPSPSTTSTTLSPGYQPRPDGRVIDYMADPNFPRELKGADLTNYPFYISVPEKIDFECKGRHDGYYTNIDLHCQIYHHCAVGNRYDFLCPNYTLFDQTTFTCRFINTVDCEGSVKHFDRNNALYVEKEDKSGAGPETAVGWPVAPSSAAPQPATTSAGSTPAPALSQTSTGQPRLTIHLSQRAAKSEASRLLAQAGAAPQQAPPR